MRLVATAILVLLATGCVAGEADPRPQTVLYLNTDLDIPRLADTLRIDVYGPRGVEGEPRTWVRPNDGEWPVSLGVLPRDDGEPARLRIRLYPSTFTARRNPSEWADTVGLEPDDPIPQFVVDRLVTITPPSAGLAHVEVLLGGDCIGLAADLDAWTGCAIVDGSAVEGSPATAGLGEHDGPLVAGEDSVAGSWTQLEPVGCTGEPRSDSGVHDAEVCIPGGVFFMGDTRLAGNAGVGEAWASIPERLVRMSPFYMDRYEVTVGRFREHARAIPTTLWDLAATSFGCTFASDGSADDFPMNCVSYQAAEMFCALDGGRVIQTEAQWEYVASGLGAEHMYVWGNEVPACEHVAYARADDVYARLFMGGSSTEPGGVGRCVGVSGGPDSTPPPAGPVRVGDFPADSVEVVEGDPEQVVYDLGGSMEEITSDRNTAYGSRDGTLTDCWAELVDPTCDEGGNFVTRGGYWAGAPGGLPVGLRRPWNGTETSHTPWTGFRCVRPAAP